MSAPIPMLLCFDVEPDEVELTAGARPWLGFESLLERVGPWRDELGAATGRPVRFNWFLRMDPQIAESHGSATWVMDRYGAAIEGLRVAGDVIGLHPHDWHWSAANSRWVADHADPDWIDECMHTSYEAYLTAFGEPCRVQRFGDRMMTARALRLAAELGARVDLTLEPGVRSRSSLHPGVASTGRTPDMTRAPRDLYRPSRDDPFVAGDEPIWLVPLTSMDPDTLLPAWRRVARRIRYPRRPLHRPSTLTAAWPARPFWSLVERELGAMARPYLAFAIRSDAPVRPRQLVPIIEKLAALRTLPIAERLVVTTPDAVVAEASTTPSA